MKAEKNSLQKLDLKIGTAIGNMSPFSQAMLLGSLRILMLVTAYCLLAYPAGYMDITFLHLTNHLFSIDFHDNFKTGLIAIPLITGFILLISTGIVCIFAIIAIFGGLFNEAML